MAATYGSGNQSPPVIGRPLERVFEDAQTTGEVNLSGRKLKDYPKISNKYDLIDTIASDLSKNRLNEVPPEVCEYQSMEKLNCYHNVIKYIPEAIVQLQALTHLNLSRNQLTVLPPYMCHLQMLEVLIASNNKLVSLPEEIGKLEKLMDLDVSCNEISHLPVQIGDLASLKCLNIRRNLLVELPIEISKLNLRKLDFANNRIEKIPTVFRKIDTLQEIILENNPLSIPPAHICTRGRQHIMKFLQSEAIREDRKRGILNDTDMKRLVRKSLPPQQTSDELRNMLESPESRWKRHTVLSSDSGYSTTDSIEKCGWSEGASEFEEANPLAIKAAEVVREQRHGRDLGLHRRFAPDPYHKLPLENQDMSDLPLPPPPHHPLSPLEESPPITPPTPVAHVSSSSLEDQFTRELQRQKLEYERRKKMAEQLRLQQQEDDEREERRRTAVRLQEEQQAVMERQRDDQQRQMEEAKMMEEAKRQEEARQQEELRRQEEIRLQEEDAHQREEARLREEQRLKEEQRQREESKKADAGRRAKQDNKKPATRLNPRRHTVTVDTSKKSFAYSPVHDGYYSSTYHNASFEYGRKHDSSFEYSRKHDSSFEYGSLRHDSSFERSFDSSYDEQYSTYIKEWAYRNKQQLGTSQSLKEEKKVQNAQYRRTTSDTTVRKANTNHNNTNSHIDNLNYINRNGVAEEFNTSADSVSTNASPRTSISSQSSIPTSPATTPISNIPLVTRLQSSDKTGSNQSSPVVRRARAGDRSGVSSPATSRVGYRAGTANTNSRIQPPSTKRNNTVNPQQEDEFKQKQQALSNKHQSESQILKKRLEESKLKHIQKEAVQNYVSKVSASRRGTNEIEEKKRSPLSSGSRSTRTGLSQASIKMLEDYKDTNPNFTIRRQHEMQLEEIQQMDQLRNTIESRLKVTLPDNLPEALKDGVVLCHLANQIRPRSVASIHVPSPAVPKLTMAKCRRNVENFLEACRKIGVNQDDLCSSADVTENLRIALIAKTVHQLVAFPRLTARDYYITYLCISILCLTCVLLFIKPL
ncbi:leucine-rich repeat and calponin homology domain-containing protein 2-like isoform X3 [Gigantopelta aegis]|uniref:leucine-rich repeat and calponin homology domain-containing protein 2-like isoform X3 n=1 Tax=Gigantopelta aegis TaxID=1735272 RepID=UPI001B88B7E1|nr:leucine-rich repeat and calponin homology domain-containing protein 2-like isoform X3 [Gigantopelta aegis]